MTTSESPRPRAWVPATVTSLSAVVLLFGCGLLAEYIADRDLAVRDDPDSLLNAFVVGPLAPLGGPGIIGPLPFGDSMAQLGVGLVPVVLLVFVFTWVSARAGALAVLLGAWLGTTLGTGLGALASFEYVVLRAENGEDAVALQRFFPVSSGLYWGATVGLLLGLVALAARQSSRRRRDLAVTGPSDEPGTDGHRTAESASATSPATASDTPPDTAPDKAPSDRSDGSPDVLGGPPAR